MVTAEIYRLGWKYRVRVCGRTLKHLFDTPEKAMRFLEDYLCGGAK